MGKDKYSSDRLTDISADTVKQVSSSLVYTNTKNWILGHFSYS